MARDTSRDRILLVDEQPEVQRAVIEMLEDRDQQVVVADTAKRALTLVGDAAQPFSLVLLDLDLGGGVDDGFTLLGEIKRLQPDLPVVILTGNTSIENAKRAFKGGANDFLEKDTYLADNLEVSFEKIAPFRRVVAENKALRRRTEALERTATFLRRKLEHRYRIVGRSAVIRTLLDTIEKVAPIPRPVLVVGERGSGKELVAAAIHYNSPRKRKRFIKLNCGALTTTLLESELFGHEAGSFTDARKQKIGRFELADEGTLFLDEITETAPEFQVRLLRVLQEQEFERVGGTQTVRVDVRVIAATNRDVESAVRDGRFREDLYYRLNVVRIEIPPLRERRDDIPLLVHAFLEEFCRENGKPLLKIAPKAMTMLCEYDWPGNVRQLRNAIEGMVVLAQGREIGARNLPEEIRAEASSRRTLLLRVGATLAEMEKEMIRATLEETKGNRAAAARILGLGRKTLYRKIEEYGLSADEEG